MPELYLDRTEIALMDTCHGFTAGRKPMPEEGLTIPRFVDENTFSLNERGDYVVCRRKDGQQGDYYKYIKQIRS